MTEGISIHSFLKTTMLSLKNTFHNIIISRYYAKRSFIHKNVLAKM
ncbi:protein of unknown function [Maridesulfovibrio hydrothermalis AM13 = DSM 14728]|uniref:Uncharacterized protein n=1 Tax=Maridesulfovibrio hydrothermalis AM13 = DSM 14728 TaxID=1121451 RepID=L0RF74_9BACT|nr:protein of unknown function [Maridesulfovibrio hydrothermalis AM13 = DSM 14728]